MDNLDKKRKRNRDDYYKNKEKRQAKHREWLSDPENYEKSKQRAREYKKENRLKIKIQKNNRYKNDPFKRLESSCRNRLRYAVRRNQGLKTRRTFDLIGCSTKQLVIYLESKFYGGMRWDDFGYGPGKFQIDHIEPCCSFDLSNPEQQKKCFNYSNLQPLWHEDHIKKFESDRKKCI